MWLLKITASRKAEQEKSATLRFEEYHVNIRSNSMREILCGFACALMLFSTPGLVSAAVTDSASQAIVSTLTGRLVSDIVDDVRMTGVDLIDQAQNTGNALIARSGNEATVLAGNLDILLKDDISLTFDKLSEERKQILIESESLRRSLVAVKDGAYDFKDSTVLDLNSIASSLPFVKKNFFVQSVRGLAYLPESGSFTIQVAAPTLGIQSDVSTKIEVISNARGEAKPIPNVRVDQSKQRFFADIIIPNEALISEFSDSTLTILPLTLKFSVSQKKGWWIFSRTDLKTYDVPVSLSLFPRTAGTLLTQTKSPAYQWVKVGSKTDSYTTPNRHCEDDCRSRPTYGGNRIEFAVTRGFPPYKVGHQQLRNPDYKCIGGVCWFSDAFNMVLTENDSRLIFTWGTWSRPGTWQASADIYEYQSIGEIGGSIPGAYFYFGKTVEILVPSDMTYGSLTITTFTKQKYELTIGQADPHGLLKYQGTTSAGNGQSRVIYAVNYPVGVKD